jgi:hypothetical protein
MAYRLLGAHVNAALSGLAEALQGWKPPLVVVLDHSDVWRQVKLASPKTIFVGRLFQPSEPDFNNPALNAWKAARDHCDKILPQANKMGTTYDYWQGVNEPVIQSADAMRRLADFEAERARILDANGFRVVVGSFSVGNPELGLWNQFIPALDAARQHRGALALHEYAWPSLDYESPWYLLRHRKVYHGEPAHGWQGLPASLKGLPLLVTECGLDGLIREPGKPHGWQAVHGPNPAGYLQELAWYDAELQKDPYVVGAALYCCCSVDDGEWGTYNIWPAVVRMLGQQARPLYRLEQLLQPVPRPAPRKPPLPVRPSKKVEPPAEVPAKKSEEPPEPASPEPPPKEAESPKSVPGEPAQPAPSSPRRSGYAGARGERRPYALSSPALDATPQPDEEALNVEPASAAAAAEMLRQARESSERIMLRLQRGRVSADLPWSGRSKAMSMQVLDRQGQERDADWLVSNFGVVCLERPKTADAGAKVYRLASVHEVAGPAALVVTVVDEQGKPLAGVQVVHSSPNAPQLPALPPGASRWLERGVVGATGSKGAIAFGLGANDRYALPGGGPAAVWVAGPEGPSDLISGLGMPDSAANRHLDVCFRLEDQERAAQPARAAVSQGSAVVADAEPLPALSTGQWKQLLQRLDQIAQALEDRLGG